MATVAQMIAAARGHSAEDVVRLGRAGGESRRGPDEVGIHAVRAGEIAGDHTVIFAGSGERIELTHRAASREPFARGALLAARFVVSAGAGLYGMGDVLGGEGGSTR